MLSLFRNFTKSRVGLVVVFAFLITIFLAFGLSDVTGLRSMGTATKSNVVATIGNQTITEDQLRDRVDRYLANVRRKQPVTIEEFLASGDYESIVDELIDKAALLEYAKRNGMIVSKALIDGEIASIPDFQGPDGKFDQKKFDGLLAQQRVSLQMFRDDFTQSRYGTWLVNPIVSTAQVPESLVSPYASFLLERRKGTAGIVRWADVPKPAEPDDRTLATYYAANRARFVVPERRVFRYALVKVDEMKAKATATEAQIQDAYKKAGTRFAAKELRSAHQLVLLDQATAQKVAGEIKAGKSIEEEAKAMGLSAANFASLEKDALLRQTSAEVANAVFAAADGAVIGPVQSQLGWVVLHVDKVEKLAAKSLDEARPELAKEVATNNAIAAIVDLHQRIEDGADNSMKFDDLMRDTKLTPQLLGPVAANGTDPLNPEFKLDPVLAPIIQTGFTLKPEDDPQLVQIGKDGSFAIMQTQKVIAAAPRPLAEIRKQVHDFYIVDEALKKARAVAIDIVNQINRGMPMPQVMASHGANKVPLSPFDLSRAELEGKQDVPAHIILAFSMAPKRAKYVLAPNRAGYLIVYLDAVEEKDASADAAQMAKMRANLARAIPQEHGLEFMDAIRHEVKVQRNAEVIARLKAEYARSGGRSGS